MGKVLDSQIHGVPGFATLVAFRRTPQRSGSLDFVLRDKRLDISMQATVLQEPWRQLFTDGELEMARKRLKELGYSADG